jgi:hypothetical protein
MFQKMAAITIVVLAATSFAPLAVSISQNDIAAVVLTGQLAPNSNGARFTGLGRPSINRAGVIAFRAELTASDVPYGTIQGKLIPSGIFIVANNTVSRLVGYGDKAPGPSVPFTNFGDPVVDDQGHVAFVARIGPGFDNQTLFLQTGSDLTSIAQTNTPAPGTGGLFTAIGAGGIAMNQSDTIVFAAKFNGVSSGEGLFLYSAGKLTPLILQGQPVPNGQGQVLDHVLGFSINDSGQIAFSASLAGGLQSEGSAVFLVSPSRQITLAHAATQPEALANQFNQIPELSLNAFGDIAFVETAQFHARGRLPAPYNVSITSSGKTSVISASRQPATPSDPVITGNFHRPSIMRGSDGTNTLLFLAASQVPNMNALWLYQHNLLSQLVKEGDVSVAGGTYFAMGQASLSSSGQIVFVANLHGSSAQAGIFLTKIAL